MSMKVFRPISLALLALAAAGFIAAAWQTYRGLGVTAMREPVVWGLYVVGFAYFFGLGSGALTIAGASIASRRAEFRESARIAASVALISLVLAGGLITLDLGRPERAWMLMLKAQPQSPLVVDVLALNAMLALAFVFVCFTFRLTISKHGLKLPGPFRLPFAIGSGFDPDSRGTRLVRGLAAVTVVAVPVLYLLTVRVFSSLEARPVWHSALLAPSFLISAMLAGTAAVGLASILADPGFVKRPVALVWRRAVIGLAGTALVLQASPLLTMRQFASPPTLADLDNFGAMQAIEAVPGLLLPLLLLGFGRIGRFRAAFAGILFLSGVFVKRWHVIVSGMSVRNLPLGDGVYTPNLIEVTATAGIAAAGFVLVLLLSAFTPGRAYDAAGKNA